MLEEFERDFAKFCEAKYCVGVANGTDAVRFALMAAGVRPGDVVITVPNTFIATTEAISQAGGVPDVRGHGRKYLQPRSGEAANLSGKAVPTRGFDGKAGLAQIQAGGDAPSCPCILYGQMADMDPILDLASDYHLVVVEDACQAHGAKYFSAKEDRWRKAGSMGLAAASVFIPARTWAPAAKRERSQPTTPKWRASSACCATTDSHANIIHEIEGYNGRLDALQAGLLHVKLQHLAEWNEQRREVAERYHQLFQEAPEGMTVPLQVPWAKSVYHLYVIRCQNRTALMEDLAKAGIGSGIHYPIPLHLQAAYSRLGYAKGDFPVTEKLAPEILSLPMFPTLTPDEQSRVCSAIVNSVSAMGVDRGGDGVPARRLQPAIR